MALSNAKMMSFMIKMQYYFYILFCMQLLLPFQVAYASIINRTSNPISSIQNDEPYKMTAHIQHGGSITRMQRPRAHHPAPQNLYPPDDSPPANDDYFVSYDTDYVNPPNNFSAMIYDGNSDSPSLFPNPEMMVYDSERYRSEQPPIAEPDVLPEVELPGDWLADTDLRERNLIDSVEYVYYGGGRASRARWAAPPRVAAALSAILTGAAALVLLYRKNFRASKMFPVEMNLLSCFMATNVIFLVGVQDTTVELRCEIVALLLHYTHLVCAAWIFVYCYVISDNVTRGCVPNLRYNYLFAYGVPAVLVLFFYAISIESYETKDYCWMSLEKGMLLGFMVPATVLILATTLFAMVGLKAISRKQQEAVSSSLQSYLAQTIAYENNRAKVAANSQQGDKYTSNNSLVSVDSIRRVEGGYKDYDAESDRYRSKGELEEHMEGTSWVRSGSTGQVLDGLDNGDQHSCRIVNPDTLKVDLSSLSMDNISWKTTEPEDMSDMRKCLNFALLMQPLFCVFWFLGVVALENADQVLPAFIFAFLWSQMHLFMLARFSFVLPYIPYEEWCAEVDEAGLQPPQKSQDTIPLLVSKPDPTTRDVRPPDSISTISN